MRHLQVSRLYSAKTTWHSANHYLSCGYTTVQPISNLLGNRLLIHHSLHGLLIHHGLLHLLHWLLHDGLLRLLLLDGHVLILLLHDRLLLHVVVVHERLLLTCRLIRFSHGYVNVRIVLFALVHYSFLLL